MKTDDPYVYFDPGVVYRGLEIPHLFHVARDELYELDDDGLIFVKEMDGSRRRSGITSRDLIEYAESEGLVACSDQPVARALPRGDSPTPSLRYLEMIITLRCNLRCGHCYLGEPRADDMDPAIMASVIREFDEMQGLRLLLSGGEPLLYPHRERLAAELSGRGFRVVLLSNGLALDREAFADLPLHEVQISLDGLAKGHDLLRGSGSFARAVAAARLAAGSGLDLSIATMIHPGSLAELDGLEKLVRDLGAREWSLDLPVSTGRWEQADEVSVEEAARAMARGFGGSYHGSAEGFACGLHLASVMPGGEVCQCGFYADSPLGNAESGLRRAWEKRRAMTMSELAWCRECEAADECCGGCRFRAGGKGPDLVMCAAYGWPRGKPGLEG